MCTSSRGDGMLRESYINCLPPLGDNYLVVFIFTLFPCDAIALPGAGVNTRVPLTG